MRARRSNLSPEGLAMMAGMLGMAMPEIPVRRQGRLEAEREEEAERRARGELSPHDLERLAEAQARRDRKAAKKARRP